MASGSKDDWDILPKGAQSGEFLSPQRIMRELKELCTDPPYGVFVEPDEDLSIVHALIIGADDTPYKGGLFYFILQYPLEYPRRPPRAKLMTTGGGSVRFNPNLYESGKVCLSILGTWPGPTWNPNLSIATVLTSIQGVLNENPYHNEPGYATERLTGDAEKYNRIILHETIRIAVCSMIENESGLNIPPKMKKKMEDVFLENFDYYKRIALTEIALTGSQLQDPFMSKRGNFEYQSILIRLEKIREALLSSRVPKQSNIDQNTALSPENFGNLSISTDSTEKR